MGQWLQRILVVKRNTSEITTTALSTALSTKNPTIELFPVKTFLHAKHLCRLSQKMLLHNYIMVVVPQPKGAAQPRKGHRQEI